MSIDENTIKEILIKNEQLIQRNRILEAIFYAHPQCYENLEQNTSQNQELPRPDFLCDTITFIEKIKQAPSTHELLAIIAMRIKELLQKAAKPMQSLEGTQKNQNSQLYVAISYMLCLCIEELFNNKKNTSIKTTIKKLEETSYLIELPLYAQKEIYIFQFLINAKKISCETQKNINQQAHPGLTTHIWTFDINIINNSPSLLFFTNEKASDPFFSHAPKRNYLSVSLCDIDHNIALLKEKIYQPEEITFLLQSIVEKTIQKTKDYHNKNFKYLEKYFHILLFYAYGFFPTDTVEAEVAAGQGFIDLLINKTSQPIIIEIKANNNADTALNQINQKKYFNISGLQKNNTLLIGINITCDENTKHVTLSSKSEDKNVTISPFQKTPPLLPNKSSFLTLF